MDFNRRDLFKGFFSGVVVSAFGAEKFVEVYHEHEHYTASGKFNVWYVQDDFWHLVSDNHRAPFEFASHEDAETFVERERFYRHPRFCSYDPEANATILPRNHPYFAGTLNGAVITSRAPDSISDFQYLRLTDNEAKILIAKIDTEVGLDSYLHSLVYNLLTAKNGAEQSILWCGSLNIPETKRKVLKLQRSDIFRSFIHSVYFGDGSNNYHTHLAKLETFSPSSIRRLRGSYLAA